jgi:hypothetical protein
MRRRAPRFQGFELVDRWRRRHRDTNHDSNRTTKDHASRHHEYQLLGG